MNRHRQASVAFAVLVVVLFGPGPSAWAAKGDTILVSRASGVTGEKGNSFSSFPSISADGRYVAFESLATNLSPNDAGINNEDVYVRDTATNSTVLVPRADAGKRSTWPSTSGDGRYIAYQAVGSGLEASQIYLFDRITEDNIVVSAGAGGPGDQSSRNPKLSGDGRFVAFSSFAGNLTPFDTNGLEDVFVHTVEGGNPSIVSAASGTSAGADSPSHGPSISGDGRFVAFASGATNLDPDDTDVGFDVFIRDQETAVTTLLSRASGATGENGGGGSYYASISADGRYVAFDSFATNLSPDDTDAAEDVYVRDTVTDSTTLVSRASGVSGEKGDGPSFYPSISADGRYVAFGSSAGNLVADDASSNDKVLVRDLVTNSTTLVSRASGVDGKKANGHSSFPSLSGDGRFVAFQSDAANLSPDDTDTDIDIFIRDLVGPPPSQSGPAPASRSDTPVAQPRDVRSPALRLTVARTQPVRRVITATATCDENCVIAASGNMSARGAGKIRLRGSERSLAAGKRFSIKLELTKKARRAAKRALRRRSLVLATVRVRATDGAGNVSSARRVVRLVR